MGYQLGVDLGTTYTAAAIGRDGHAEPCTLGSASPIIPSVVLLRADGDVLVGDVAVRRGLAEPTRVAREFKRRLGDPTPLVLGGTPYGAESLMAHVLRSVVATVTAREGEAPTRVVLTHPANYGPYKLEMMAEVARQAGLDLDRVDFITEPQAAAVSYAARNRVEPGEIIAVYDFGGGTFDAALLQQTDDGFALIGRPDGMERFGGIDIDSAIMAFLDDRLDGGLSNLPPEDPAVQASMLRLRDDIRLAKETLSADTDTDVLVNVPGIQQSVRITRADLEEMIRPRLAETVDAVRRTVNSAGIDVGRVSRVLLVGGSSQIPLVAEAVRLATGRPVAIDAHPKLSIALGAANHRPPLTPPGLHGSVIGGDIGSPIPNAPGGRTPRPAATVPEPVVARVDGAPPAPPSTPIGTAAGRPQQPDTSGPAGSSRRRLGLIAAGALAVTAAGIGIFLATSGGDGSSTLPTTPLTNPVTTPDTTAATIPVTTPVTAPATTPVATPATTPVTTPATTPPPEPLAPLPGPTEIESALITLGDLSAGFANDVVTGSSTDLCGVVFNAQPIVLRQVGFTRNPNTPEAEGLLNGIEVFESADEAKQLLAQQTEIVNGACNGFTSNIGGQEFTTQAIGVDAAPLKPLLPPQCSDITMVQMAQVSVDDPTAKLTTSYVGYRCGNILAAISTQFGGDVQPQGLAADATAALVQSINRVSALSIRQ